MAHHPRFGSNRRPPPGASPAAAPAAATATTLPELPLEEAIRVARAQSLRAR